MKRTRCVFILILLTACFEYPTELDECLDTCNATAELCLTGSDLCFQSCGNDILCAKDCYRQSQRCTVDALKCASACIREAEEKVEN